jgi:ABC-type dipeptide/oligopeptide/nickel transport system permease subunit
MMIAILGLLLLVSLLSSLLPLSDANTTNLAIRSQGPSWEHPLGTDQLGRSLLARIIQGAKYTIGMSVFIILCAMLIGIPLGLFSALKGNLFDRTLMWLSEMMLILPSFILALIIVALTNGALLALIIPLVSFYSASLFRVARATATRMRNQGFVIVAQWMGHTPLHLIRTHIWPNSRRELLAVSCSDLGAVMLVISGLSFVGIGLDPATAEWGAMLHDAQRVLLSHPWELSVPAFFIMMVCFFSFQLSHQFSEETTQKDV